MNCSSFYTSIMQQVVDELYLGESPFSFVDTSMKDAGYPHTNIVPARINNVLDRVLVPPCWWASQ
jgi:hypothetical protein